mmetsp:Transcript_3594/g.9991  ORF Transcript_3594/g.9991 Transcript_3594/m.9991 type:complete len:411 (-) Transcript_3594:26-1258(-)
MSAFVSVAGARRNAALVERTRERKCGREREPEREHERPRRALRTAHNAVAAGSATGVRMAAAGAAEEHAPLLVRAARHEEIERPPVWMMRQAGRYMKVYQDLARKHTSFRERSENTDLSTEISLQPWRAFKPDGVILFSDILTPLPGMGIDFEIPEDKGPIIEKPIRTMDDVARVHELDAIKSTPFVRETLQNLRSEVGDEAAVLGFIGAPYTLATYCVEGRSSSNYLVTKKLMYTQPEIMHALLTKIAENIGAYACYQIESGAQAVQMFDSWAGVLSPVDFDVFALPYHKMVVDIIKKRHPSVPLIVYISQGASLIERMASAGFDVVSVDWTVDMADARARLPRSTAVQGNIDPAVLYGSHETITQRVLDTIQKAGRTGHIMNLGHGVMPTTPEENVAHYFQTVRNFRY